MRKTISVIATVLFIIGTCGIIGGLAAKERVPIMLGEGDSDLYRLNLCR